MTVDENILWKKISTFNLDDESSSFKFSTRLARENGWTLSYSKAVIEEYKKFIFLCCIHKTGTTPSDQVDQVWHLHLTYTKSYWIDLCRNTLSKEIHHNPAKGGQKEGEKFDDYYTETIKLYKDKFKAEPPKNIWPDNDTRFSDINFQRVNLKKNWVIRRPSFRKSNISIFIILILSLFFIQSQSSDSSGAIFGLVVVLSIITWNVFKNKGGGNGSGCSTGGCGDGHSGCGGDSGCGSGCSGCGGGD